MRDRQNDGWAPDGPSPDRGEEPSGAVGATQPPCRSDGRLPG